MKKLFLTLVVVVLMSGLILSSCAEPAPAPAPAPSPAPAPAPPPEKAVTLRWAHFAASHLTSSQLLVDMSERVKQRTNGRYNIQIFWSDSLVPMFESMDAVRTGSTEMATWPFGPFSSADIRFASSEVPLLYNTVEAQLEGQALLMPDYSSVLEEKFNQKAISVSSIISLEVGSTKKPIKTLADWKGLMCQSISPQLAAVIDAFGGTGVPISPIEVYSSLEKGIVDATIQSQGKFVEAKLWEVCPYLTDASLVPAAVATSVNLDVLNKMPKDVQDILIDEGKKLITLSAETTLTDFYDYQEQLAANMEVYYLPKAERERWKETVRPVIDSLLAEMGDFAQRVRQTADEANAKYPYPY